MADFKTHITAGVATGAAWSVLTHTIGVPFTLFWHLQIWLFALIGSFLPDMDSDSGLPFKIAFGSVSLATIAIVFTYTLQFTELTFVVRSIQASMAGGMVWFILGGLFKKLTVHRGMWHSIPAAVITFLLSFYFIRLNSDLTVALILSFATTTGFFSHLVLDTVYGSLTFMGNYFMTPYAVGSPLKFFSPSILISISLYLLITILFVFQIDSLLLALRNYLTLLQNLEIQL